MKAHEAILNGFREPEIIKALTEDINTLAKELKREINIMEVCGGHTHTIVKYGINQILDKKINFIHGPGCPVCVMPKSRIDNAIDIAKQSDVIFLTLADMIKVPGSEETLQKVRADGADVRFLYSPLDSIKIAKENPDKKVVFFAIGFETTTPMTPAIIKQTIEQNIKNLSFYINHITVPEPMEALLQDKESKIDAFIAPSHVSVITGAKIYEKFPKEYNRATVVSGFEPVDVLQGVKMIIEQILKDKPKLEIQYRRSVTIDGNLKAQKLIDSYFKKVEFEWRGIGFIPDSSYELLDKFDYLNAKLIYKDIFTTKKTKENRACICTEILKGKAKPTDCKAFKTICNPSNPIGSCMVSSEGACSAYYKYNQGII